MITALPILLTYRTDGTVLGYLLSETGDSGGVWKTSHMELSMEGDRRVAVIAKVSNDWDGTMAFTNVVLEEGLCSEGALPFSLWNLVFL